MGLNASHLIVPQHTFFVLSSIYQMAQVFNHRRYCSYFWLDVGHCDVSEVDRIVNDPFTLFLLLQMLDAIVVFGFVLEYFMTS